MVSKLVVFAAQPLLLSYSTRSTANRQPLQFVQFVQSVQFVQLSATVIEYLPPTYVDNYSN